MTLERKRGYFANKNNIIDAVVLESEKTGWKTVFEKWENGVITRRFIAPRRRIHKTHPVPLKNRELERYEFDWDESVVVDKAKK